MKRIQLKDVMASLRIVANETGYEVHNAAGTAKYDAWGYRREVNGIPEYFPDKISVEGGSVSISSGEFHVNDSTGQPRCVVGSLSDKPKMKVGPINIELNLDTTGAQKALDDIQKVINDSSQAFKSFQERVRKETTSITWSGSLKLGINRDIDAVIENAVVRHTESERIKAAMEEAARKATIDAVATVLKDFQTRGPLRRSLGI
ncbi:hypothetical protein F3J34_13895 [Klebsiella sp. Ap-873]|nr:hypothetical protein [Klebsiella sp. Ap-873]